MPVFKQIDRQYPKVAVADLGIANIGVTNTVTVTIPANALVTSVLLQTAIAFDTASTGTATGTATDGTTSYVTAQDLKTAGAETSVGAPKFYPTGGVITFSVAEVVATTTATVGRALGVVEYLIVGNGDAGIHSS